MSYPSMYSLYRKLETKSPKIEQNDELTSRDPEDRPRNLQNMISRPKSAKTIEKRLLVKKKNGRPISAKKNLVNIASKLSIKPSQDAYLLNRLKPTLIAIDKERLYEDNMALKLALNGLQSENLKVKTRITQLEKELSKKDDIIEELSTNEKTPGHKHIHLANNLKQVIKQSKYEIKSRDEEILKLKRNIKSTKNNELEIQIQSYEEECKRLSVTLAEALNKQNNFYSTSEYDKKFSGELVNSLKRENNDLKAGLAKAQDELRRLQQEKVQENDKKKKNSSQQVVSLKLEVQKLRTQIENKEREGKEKETLILNELNAERRKSEDFKNKLESEERKNKELLKQIESLKNSIKSKENERKSASPRPSARQLRIVVDIKAALKKQKVSLKNLINSLDKDHLGFVDIEEFLKTFKAFGKTFKINELEDLSEKKSGKVVINLIKLQKQFSKLSQSSSSSGSDERPLFQTSNVPIFSPEFSPQDFKSPVTEKPETSEKIVTEKPEVVEKDLQNIFQHFSLCMQLNRIQKSQLLEIFFPSLRPESSLSRSDLLKIMKHPPIALPQKLNIEKLVDFLMKINSKLQNLQQVKEIIAKLQKFLPDWQVFEADEEEKFDSELARVIQKHKKQIKENCRAFDKRDSGSISLEQFKVAIKDFGELSKGRLFQYMTLLFYSHEYELDKVPYIHFIRAYGEQNTEDSQEYSESEKAQIVKHYLHEIAQSLKKHKQSVREVFQVENMLIYPESFITGLETLGLKNIEHDFLVLILEALQYDKGNEACILIDEFEKIMENLGVSHSPSQYKESSSDEDSEEIKKISIAESANYEYSDDSPGRQKISEISPFASISNPHMKKPSSHSGKTGLKDEAKEKNEASSKFTLAISKIESQTYKKKDSSSDSIQDILEQNPPDSPSSSFGSRKKNQPMNLKDLRYEEKLETVKRKDSSSDSSSSQSMRVPRKAESQERGINESPLKQPSLGKNQSSQAEKKTFEIQSSYSQDSQHNEVSFKSKENKEDEYQENKEDEYQENKEDEYEENKEDEYEEKFESSAEEQIPITRKKSEKNLKGLVDEFKDDYPADTYESSDEQVEVGNSSINHSRYSMNGRVFNKTSSASSQSSKEVHDKFPETSEKSSKKSKKNSKSSSNSEKYSIKSEKSSIKSEKSSMKSKKSSKVSKNSEKSSKIPKKTPKNYSSSSSSKSSKKVVNPKIPLEFKEDMPEPASKLDSASDPTARFESKDPSNTVNYSVRDPFPGLPHLSNPPSVVSFRNNPESQNDSKSVPAVQPQPIVPISGLPQSPADPGVQANPSLNFPHFQTSSQVHQPPVPKLKDFSDNPEDLPKPAESLPVKPVQVVQAPPLSKSSDRQTPRSDQVRGGKDEKFSESPDSSSSESSSSKKPSKNTFQVDSERKSISSKDSERKSISSKRSSRKENKKHSEKGEKIKIVHSSEDEKYSEYEENDFEEESKNELKNEFQTKEPVFENKQEEEKFPEKLKKNSSSSRSSSSSGIPPPKAAPLNIIPKKSKSSSSSSSSKSKPLNPAEQMKKLPVLKKSVSSSSSSSSKSIKNKKLSEPESQSVSEDEDYENEEFMSEEVPSESIDSDEMF